MSNTTPYIQKLFTSRDNNANAATYVGQLDRIWWDPVTNAFYYSDGTTAGGIQIGGGGGNGVPGGSNTQIQFNNAGSFGGSANLTWNGSVLSVTGNVAASYFIGDGSQLSNIGSSNLIYNGNSWANIADADGNLVINVGDITWTFDTNGNLITAGNISANTITANYFIGDGSNISNITGANVTGLATVTFDTVPPGDPVIGDIWIDSNSGVQYIYFNDVAGNVWAEMEAQNAYSSTGYANITSDSLNTQVLYNNAGAVWGSNNLTFTGSVLSLAGTANLGNLTISNQTISGINANQDVIIATNDPANVALYGNLVVSPDSDTLPYPPIDGVNKPVAWFGGADGRTSIMYLDSFADGNPIGSPSIALRRFEGTKAFPTAVGTGQTLGSLLFRGFDGTSFQSNAYSGMIVAATENFSPVQQGTTLLIRTIPAGSNAATTVATFKNDSVTIGNFIISDENINIANSSANITIGNIGATGNLQSLRPFQIIANASGAVAFEVARDGLTTIFTPDPIANTEAALNIVGTSSGNVQPRSPTFTGTMLQITGQDNTTTRVSIDAFGSDGAQNSYAAIAARVARGTVDAPTALQTDDLMMRLAMQGWTGNGVYAPSIARLNFAAAEAFTSNASVGTYANIQLTPIGTNTIKTVTGFSANGISFPNTGAGGTGNLGITFQDGSYQNTAYDSTTVVRSATAGQGITIAPTGTSATGNITITNTGIVGVIGTANQVIVTSNVSGVVTLGTPQSIGTSSNVIFQSLTVTDLTILGNVSNVIPSVVDGPVVYVSNTATTYNDINNSGLITGNVANGYWSGMLFDTDTNTWTFNLGNSIGITAGDVFGNSGQFLNQVHIGYANATINFPDASIQADCSSDSYNQIVMQNHYQGANASADFVAVPNNGDDSNFYIDMGINSNVYNNSDYAAMGANDGYLYVNGGDLIVGTQTPGQVITFITGGTNSATAYDRATISDTGLSVVGNIDASNISANIAIVSTILSVVGNITGGNLITTGTLSTTGNITGGNVTGVVVSASGNVLASGIRSTGNISASGNVIGANVIASSLIVANSITATGNIAGGQLLTAGNLSASGNVTGTYVVATVSVNTVNLNATGFVSAVGAVVSSDGITATGNITGGNIRTVGQVSATGNITGNYFLGNGSQLTGLTTSNAFGNVYANGTAVLATTGSSTITLSPGNNQVITGNNTSKTVTIAVNDNPTFANLSVTGNITVSGNILTANTTYLANVGNILFSNVAPLGTAYPGVMEFDGRALYFTGQDQERGIVPNQEWYVLNSDRGLTYATTTPQSLFGVGTHVSNSTRYWFRIKATVSRAAGTNNTALTLGWRGSAVLSKITYAVDTSIGAVSTAKAAYMYETTLVANFTNQLTISTTSNPPDSVTFIITGIIDVGATGAGYVDPYISWTGAAAAGAVTVSSLSNFQIYPLGITGSNTVVGNWA